HATTARPTTACGVPRSRRTRTSSRSRATTNGARERRSSPRATAGATRATKARTARTAAQPSARTSAKRRAGPASSAQASALHDADRHESRHAAGESRTRDDVDDRFDVLGRERRLLGEALVRRAGDDNAPTFELTPQLGAADLLLRRGAGQAPAGAVAGRSEGAPERPGLTREDVARGAHAAGNEDRLSDLAIRRRNLVGARGEGARRALPVHQYGAAVVALRLGDVVRDVVDLPRVRRGVVAENARDGRAGAIRDLLPVGPRKVGGRGHRREVRLSFRRGRRRARQLPVGKLDSVTAEHGVHPLDVVAADLVPEPARAGVDEDRDLP